MKWLRKVAAGLIFVFLMLYFLYFITEGIRSWGSGVQGITNMFADVFIIGILIVILWYLLKKK